MKTRQRIPGPFEPAAWVEPGETTLGPAYRRYNDAYRGWLAKASPAETTAAEQKAERALVGVDRTLS